MKIYYKSSLGVEKLFSAILGIEGVSKVSYERVVKGLIQTSLRGVDSHGIRLFPHYVKALKAGRINGNPNFNFKKTSPTTGILDADHAFGHSAGMEAVSHVKKMSSESGSGHVAIKHSTHFGAAAYYALELANFDLMGWCFTHADSLMLSHNGTRPYLGTNPYCFAAPCKGEDPFCLDMATTSISYNEVNRYKEDNEKIPIGLIADKKGEATSDTDKFGSLFPIGGYKGFGLSMVIEILCSQLSGMPFGHSIVPMFSSPISQKRNLGHFISGIKIDCFQSVDQFKTNMKEMLDQIRSEPSKDKNKKVKVPNDPEKIKFKERSELGIPIKEVDWNAFVALSKEYDLIFQEDKIEEAK